MIFRSRHHTACALLAAALLSTSSLAPALAATATAPMAVSATVLSVCLVAATNLNFGNYSATGGSPDDTTSLVTATCNPGAAYTISLDAGLGTGATVAARSMLNGLSTLPYAIYSNTGRTTIWGDGTLGTVTVPGTGNGLPQVYTAYGRVAAGLNVTAGPYADVVTVSLSY